MNHTINQPLPDHQTAHLRKMLRAMIKDIRIVFIKLADRLDNMRNLGYLPELQRQRTARETLELFAPLANRLGIGQIKWELEDLSLRYLEPDTYQRMAKLLDERRVSREHYIQRIIDLLRVELKKDHIKADISGRPKHIYSIWRKMQRKGLNFDQIFDVRAVRVLVDSIKECYMVLGIVHNKWQPVPGEFDDYIANPKRNDYRSLHTTVVGPEQKIFEVQIRTHAMHHHAELGVAAHWRYKETNNNYGENFSRQIAWLKQVLEWKEEENGASDVIDRFKSEIIEDRVYVLSPQGKVVDLPQGATPLDFAYYIHTELGHCCRGAKINNRIVPLNYALKTGEQVEILTSKEEKPSRDWLNPNLNYLKTSRARAKVKQWLKKQDIEQHIIDGRELLHRELRRLNLHNLNFEQLAESLKFATLLDFLAALGRGDITLAQVDRVINEQFFVKKPPVQLTLVNNKSEGSIYIKGVGGLLTHTARCCRPVPYDPIIGYITKGRGVVVHRRDCTNALDWQNEDNERLIEVEWSQLQTQPSVVYPVDIAVKAYDRTGLLRDVTTTLANEKINIIAVNTLSDKADNTARMVLTIEVSNLEQLSRALAKIDNLPNVIEVARKTSTAASTVS